MRPPALHRTHQLLRARHHAHALFAAARDGRSLQTLQQLHPPPQRFDKVQLAAHRTLGHGADFGLQPGIIGQLVNAFHGDHGAVHIGHEEHLAAIRTRLHHDIDMFLQRREGHADGPYGSIGGNVRRAPLIDPGPIGDRQAGIAQAVGSGIDIIPQKRFGCYQRGDGHGFS